MYCAKHLQRSNNKLTPLNFLKKLVENRLKYGKKRDCKRAANYFNNWLAFHGARCTDEGARIIMLRHSTKFEALLPGLSHTGHDKWMAEAEELGLLQTQKSPKQ